MPPNRMKWFNISFPDRKKAIDFMYELGRCEIALMVSSIPPLFRFVARGRGQGVAKFWENWNKFGETASKEAMDVRILLLVGPQKSSLPMRKR